jgi:hypothetical protein
MVYCLFWFKFVTYVAASQAAIWEPVNKKARQKDGLF